MAVFNLDNLVLRGVAGNGNVANGLTRIGTYPVDGQTPALAMSQRHPSPGCRPTAAEPERQRDHVDERDVKHASERAGRPGSRAGVLVRRSPASLAGRAVLYGWSLAVGGPRPISAKRFSPAATGLAAPLARVSSGHPSALRAWPLSARDDAQASRVRFIPAGGMSTASTRERETEDFSLQIVACRLRSRRSSVLQSDI